MPILGSLFQDPAGSLLMVTLFTCMFILRDLLDIRNRYIWHLLKPAAINMITYAMIVDLLLFIASWTFLELLKLL